MEDGFLEGTTPPYKDNSIFEMSEKYRQVQLFLAYSMVCSKCQDNPFNLLLKYRVVRFPSGEVGREACSEFGGMSTFPIKNVTVEIEWDHDKYFFATFFSHTSFFLKRGFKFFFDPPTVECRL